MNKLELFCWECGSPLRYENGEHGPSVFPCEFCQEAEYNKGYEKGREHGMEEQLNVYR